MFMSLFQIPQTDLMIPMKNYGKKDAPIFKPLTEQKIFLNILDTMHQKV